MELRALEFAGKVVTSPLQKNGSETTLRMSPRFLAVRSHEDDRQLPPDYSKRKITLDDAEDEDSGSGEDSKLDPRLTIPAKGIRTVRKRHYGCSCTQISLREPLEPNLIYIHQWQSGTT
jgi:hypothetical protein